MSALVLVVERPGPYRDALLQALAARGARTDVRDDAMEALAVAGKLEPNVVLVSDHAGPPDPQSVCRVLQRKLGNAAVYRLGDPDFSDPLAKDQRVLPRLSNADAVAAAVLDPDSNVLATPSAVEWESALDAWQVPSTLLALCERRSTGYLVLQTATVEREIALVRGMPVGARSSALDERLGAVLLRAGLVSESALLLARDAGRTGGLRLGDALLATDALDPAGLYRGLALQLQQQLIGACESTAVSARFVPKAELAARTPLLPFHPLAIALEAARRLPSDARDAGLARLSGESLAAGAHQSEADGWLRALGVRELDTVLARAADARALVDALRSALPQPAAGEQAIDAASLVLALIWCGRIEARIASALPAVPSVPLGMAQAAGGWLRVLGALRPVQLPASARPITESSGDVERAVDAYLLAPREQPLARRRALAGALADAEGERPALLRQWCRDARSMAREPARTAAAALRAALEGEGAAASGDADPLAARCRRALLRKRLELIAPEARAERQSDVAPVDSRPPGASGAAPALRGGTRSSRAAPPPPPPPRVSALGLEAPIPAVEDDQALFATVEPLLHQANWLGVVELLGKHPPDAPPLSPRLALLYAIALKEAPQAAAPGKQTADADLLGMRAVSALLRIPAESPTALIIGKRMLRKRPIEWQTAPPRRVSLLLTTIALIVGAAVGLLFNQRLIDLLWK